MHFKPILQIKTYKNPALIFRAFGLKGQIVWGSEKMLKIFDESSIKN